MAKRRARKSSTAHARDLVDRLKPIAKSGALTVPDVELTERLWTTWWSFHHQHARRYLMHLVRLAKRASKNRTAAKELSRCLSEKSLYVHMPMLTRGASTRARVRGEVARLALIDPLHRGRPRKEAPKPRFFAEVLKTLKRLGVERVTQRQAMRDYWELGRVK